MTHEKYQEQISQFIDGELEERLQSALFAHLSTCDECRRFLNATLALRSNLATGSSISLPQGFDQRVATTLLGVPPLQLLNARPAAFRLALAASIAFLLLMGGLLFGPHVLGMQPTAAQNGIVSNAESFSFPQQN